MKSNLAKSFIALALSSLLLLIVGCKEEPKSIVAPIHIEFKKEGRLTIHNSTSDSIIANFDIEVADDEYQRQTGLMHRESMKDNQAMLFVFDDVKMRSFYMKNTLISLDIIYLDDLGKIINVQDRTKPMNETSLPSISPAKYVLEINAGLTEKLDLNIGDYINYVVSEF